MPRDRLPTALWVSATLRRLNGEGVFCAVISKGEAESGTLTVRINCLDGTSLIFTEGRDLDGQLTWTSPLGPDPIADEKASGYVTRAGDRDPDIWVVEVEDRSGQNPFRFDG